MPGVIGTAKYPVVHPLPPQGLIIKSIRPTDFLVIAGFGIGAFVINWFGGLLDIHFSID